MFALLETAMELGLIYGFTVLALFLSYSMLGVCDLSTDGCFTLGAAVGSVTLLAGHPLLSLPAAMAAGSLSGFMTAALQTRLGVDPLLSGIIVNTGLYSVNIAVMGGSAQLNLNRSNTLFTLTREPLAYFLPAGLARTVLLLPLIVLTAVLLPLSPHPTGAGHPGHWEQPRYGTLLLHQPRFYYHGGALPGGSPHRPFRVSTGSIPALRRDQHGLGHPHCRAGIPPYWPGTGPPWKHPSPRRRRCGGSFPIPAGLRSGSPTANARLYA